MRVYFIESVILIRRDRFDEQKQLIRWTAISVLVVYDLYNGVCYPQATTALNVPTFSPCALNCPRLMPKNPLLKVIQLQVAASFKVLCCQCYLQVSGRSEVKECSKSSWGHSLILTRCWTLFFLFPFLLFLVYQQSVLSVPQGDVSLLIT